MCVCWIIKCFKLPTFGRGVVSPFSGFSSRRIFLDWSLTNECCVGREVGLTNCPVIASGTCWNGPSVLKFNCTCDIICQPFYPNSPIKILTRFF